MDGEVRSSTAIYFHANNAGNHRGARATPVNTRARPSTPTTSDNAWLADANDEGQLDVVADREWNIAGPPRSNESRILERGPKGWKQEGGKTGPPAGGWKFLLRVWFTPPPYYRSRGVIMTSRMRARDPAPAGFCASICGGAVHSTDLTESGRTVTGRGLWLPSVGRKLASGNSGLIRLRNNKNSQTRWLGNSAIVSSRSQSQDNLVTSLRPLL